MHKLIAMTTDNRLVMHPDFFLTSNAAVSTWYHHDDARREGFRPNVQWYAVREVTDTTYGVATIDRSAFVDTHDERMTRLTDREYGEVIGSLQHFREYVEREHGRTPHDVCSALAKITAGCTPSTNGMEFRLIDAA